MVTRTRWVIYMIIIIAMVIFGIRSVKYYQYQQKIFYPKIVRKTIIQAHKENNIDVRGYKNDDLRVITNPYIDIYQDPTNLRRFYVRLAKDRTSNGFYKWEKGKLVKITSEDEVDKILKMREVYHRTGSY